MRTIKYFIGSVALLSLVCACNDQTSQSPSSSPPGTRVVIEGPNGNLQSSQPAELKVSFGSPSIADLSFGARRNGESLSVIMRLTEQQLGSASGTITLTGNAISDGNGNAQQTTGTGAKAITGDVTMTLDKGKLTGVIKNASTGTSMKFHGDLTTSCWIPSTAPLAEGSGTVGDDGSRPLVEDSQFASDKCVGLKRFVQ